MELYSHVDVIHKLQAICQKLWLCFKDGVFKKKKEKQITWITVAQEL